MQDVLTLGEKLFKMAHIFPGADLRGLGIGTGYHCGVKLIEGHGLTQVIGTFYTVHGVMEAEVIYFPAVKMFLGQVGSGAAAQYVVAHKQIPFCMSSEMI